MKKKHKFWMSVLVIIASVGTIIVIILPASLTTTVVPAPSDIPPRNDQAIPPTTNPADDLIVVNSPIDGSVVTTPLTITGKARGSFYFEASFPIELIDSVTGLDIATGHAQAQGDWMTDEFVPFTATLTFDHPATTTQGILKLKNDNPSGLSENDKSISIPVVVK